MSDKEPRNRTLLLWLAIIIVALTVIGAMSMIFDASRSFLGIVIILMLIPTVVLVFAMLVNPAKRGGHSGGDPSTPLVADYPDKGVTVIVPWQGRAVIVQSMPSVPLDQLKSERDAFKPGGLLMNPEVLDARHPETVLTTFEPPMEIQVKFPNAAIENARQLVRKQKQNEKYEPTTDEVVAALQLGFWDGARWVQFTKEKHKLRFLTTAGIVGVVSLSKWGDPPIGWGPK